MQHFSDLFW